MKRLFLGLICLVSLGVADSKNILFDDVDWIYSRGDKICLDVRQAGLGTEVINMVNRKGYAVNNYFEKFKMTEFTNGKLIFWMFPDKYSCEKFKLVRKKNKK